MMENEIKKVAKIDRLYLFFLFLFFCDDYIYIYIYAFSRRFYPKRLTLHSSYSFYIFSAQHYSEAFG